MNNMTDKCLTRRRMMQSGILAMAGFAVLTGTKPLFAASQEATGDVSILNTALALEDEGIAAYQLAQESKLLKPDLLKVAKKFQNDHEDHREHLVQAIKKLGGTPVQPKSKEEYAKQLNASSLKSQNDVLELALRLELEAINAYLGVIPSFTDRQLAKVSGRIAADETVHWTTLEATLQKPLPKPMFFGS